MSRNSGECCNERDSPHKNCLCFHHHRDEQFLVLHNNGECDLQIWSIHGLVVLPLRVPIWYLGENVCSLCLVDAMHFPSSRSLNTGFHHWVLLRVFLPILKLIFRPGIVTRNSKMSTWKAVARVFYQTVFNPWVVSVPCLTESTPSIGGKPSNRLRRRVV